MSFNVINQFQKQIYNILSSTNEIRSKIYNIYISVVQDSACPFLLINISNVKNLSTEYEASYLIEFELCIFTRNMPQSLSIKLSSLVEKILCSENCNFDKYIVTGIKALNIKFQKAQDMVSDKLSMNYKALVKQDLMHEI